MTNPASHLSQAADAVGEFNHASFRVTDDWAFPNHAYTALGPFTRLTSRLEQALEQSVRPVMHTYEHGRVTIENGGDADQAVRDLQQALADAQTNAAALAEAVRRMHSLTSPMGLDTEGIPEFADDSDE